MWRRSRTTMSQPPERASMSRFSVIERAAEFVSEVRQRHPASAVDFLDLSSASPSAELLAAVEVLVEQTGTPPTQAAMDRAGSGAAAGAASATPRPGSASGAAGAEACKTM